MARPTYPSKPYPGLGDAFDLLAGRVQALEFLINLLTRVQDEQLVMLREILEKREFTPHGPRGWDSLTDALADIAQKIDNSRQKLDEVDSDITGLITVTGRLPGMETDLIDVRTRIMRGLPIFGEGVLIASTPLAMTGVYGLQQHCTFVVLVLSEPPAGIGRSVGDFPTYEALGRFAWLYKGAAFKDWTINNNPSVWKVPPGADAVRVLLNPGMGGQLVQYVPPEI